MLSASFYSFLSFAARFSIPTRNYTFRDSGRSSRTVSRSRPLDYILRIDLFAKDLRVPCYPIVYCCNYGHGLLTPIPSPSLPPRRLVSPFSLIRIGIGRFVAYGMPRCLCVISQCIFQFYRIQFYPLELIICITSHCTTPYANSTNCTFWRSNK